MYFGAPPFDFTAPMTSSRYRVHIARAPGPRAAVALGTRHTAGLTELVGEKEREEGLGDAALAVARAGGAADHDARDDVPLTIAAIGLRFTSTSEG